MPCPPGKQKIVRMDKFILLKRNEGRMNIREKYPALHKPFRRRAILFY
jgi:hypothetical protein